MSSQAVTKAGVTTFSVVKLPLNAYLVYILMLNWLLLSIMAVHNVEGFSAIFALPPTHLNFAQRGILFHRKVSALSDFRQHAVRSLCRSCRFARCGTNR